VHTSPGFNSNTQKWKKGEGETEKRGRTGNSQTAAFHGKENFKKHY
jgi:hypothetical protein